MSESYVKRMQRERDAALARAEEAEDARDEAVTRAERAEAKLVMIREWTRRFGRALCPPRADTYGEGIRDAKAQVGRLLDAASAGDAEES